MLQVVYRAMEAVILDVGGVLLVPHAEPVNSALAPFGIQLDGAQAERAHYFGTLALDQAEQDERAARRAYLVGYADAAGISAEHRDEALARMQRVWSGPTIDLWRLKVTGSVEGLKRLAASGCQMGIISNADGTIEEQLRRNEICQVGEGLGVPVLAIIDSHVVGIAKPAAGIFRHALEPLGVAPEEAVYVGDTVRYDVRGARAAGLRPVHFDPYDLCPAQADHAHVRRLADVEPLLNKR
ncbi:MAG: HAD family hydrolase [Chloroflexi bacterium]|nr:HAD family hydrolase [Chloroflexota bacterium]